MSSGGPPFEDAPENHWSRRVTDEQLAESRTRCECEGCFTNPLDFGDEENTVTGFVEPSTFD